MDPNKTSLPMLVGLVSCLATGIWFFPADASAGPARTLPARFQRSPYSIMSLSIGYPNDGWQLRASRLEESQSLKLRRASRELSYGHPALIRMLARGAEAVADSFAGSVLLVGDVSAREGGPLAGHRSHQSGRDADVGFFVMNAAGKPILLDRFVAFNAEGRARTERGLFFDEARNWALLTAWLKDPRARLTHVFVAAGLRERLLAYGRSTGQRASVSALARLMSQPKGVSEHDDHFHIRIACPDRHGGVCEHSARAPDSPTGSNERRSNSEKPVAEAASPRSFRPRPRRAP